MSIFFKRILQIAENKGFKNITDFSKNGLEWLSSEKLNRLRKENNKPSIDILLEISNKFDDINLHWLITGKGEMLISKNKSELLKVEEPKETYGKTEKIELDLLLKNNSLLKEQNQLQEEVIIMLREKVQFFEEKYNDCENQKKLLATSKKMD